MPFEGIKSRWSKAKFGLSSGKTKTDALPDPRTEGETIRTALTQWDLDSTAQKGNVLKENITKILRHDFNESLRSGCKRSKERDSAYSKIASDHNDCLLTGKSILLAVQPSFAEDSLARSYANACSGYQNLKRDAEKLDPSAQKSMPFMPERFVRNCLTAWGPLISNLRSIDIQLSDTGYTDKMSGALPSDHNMQSTAEDDLVKDRAIQQEYINSAHSRGRDVFVPPTPFVPSRLAEGFEENSLLLAQEPIFDDCSFDERSFWNTPKAGQSSRQPQRYQCELDAAPSDVGNVPADQLADWIEAGDLFLSGRGELSTWADEERRAESSCSTKRITRSPSSSSSTKRARTSPAMCDDYYQRRLSRQVSSTSVPSPSLSALDLSSSFPSPHSRSRQLSDVSHDGQSGVRDIGTAISQSDSEFRPVSAQQAEIEAEPTIPPRPTMLSKLLARASVLQAAPFVNPICEVIHDNSPPTSTTRADARPGTRTPPRSTSSEGQQLPRRSPPARSPALSIAPSVTGSTPSLRRSTSQRVLGYLSDLVRSTSSSTPSTTSEATDSSRHEILDDNTPSSSLSRMSRRREYTRHEDGGVESGKDLSHEAHETDASQTVQEQQSLGESYLSTQPTRPGSHTSMRQPAGFVPLTRPNKAFISNTASRAGNPIRRPNPVSTKSSRPATTSSFASTALARLPPPGKGSSSAGERVTVKPTERAANLQARRALFERPINGSATKEVMVKTVPLTGKTPGKASRARAEERHRFDKAVQDRSAERDRKRDVREQQKRDEEEKAYAARRKETVIRANPVPSMYRRSSVDRATPR